MMTREDIKKLVASTIVETLRNPKRAALAKPTIDELEKMLNSDAPAKVDILPDGSITTELPVYASDLAEAVLDALAKSSAEFEWIA